MCVCVCVYEKERERKRETKRKREDQRVTIGCIPAILREWIEFPLLEQ